MRFASKDREGDFAPSLVLELRDGSLQGDFNGDGIVNINDYTLWRDNLGSPDEGVLMGAGDGVNGVDAADYALWKSNFGATSPLSGLSGNSLTAVPESPTSFQFCFALVAATVLAGVRTRTALLASETLP